MADIGVNRSLPELERNIRKTLYVHLREIQQLLTALKGIAGDKAIVDRYGNAEERETDLDPDTPTDVDAMIRDIEDIYKQISIYRTKLKGNGNVNLRDSGISMCSDRLSQMNLEAMAESSAVENEESPDEKAFLENQAQASLNSRPQGGARTRQVVNEIPAVTDTKEIGTGDQENDEK